MDEEPKEVSPAGPTHEEILKERDAKLATLEKEIQTNPEAAWRGYEPPPFKSVGYPEVSVPARAIIETEALIQDIKAHPGLFRESSQPFLDHGDIVRLPKTFDLLMRGLLKPGTDWERIEMLVTLLRGRNICEDEMGVLGRLRESDEMEFRKRKQELFDLGAKYDAIDNALTVVEPVSLIGK